MCSCISSLLIFDEDNLIRKSCCLTFKVVVLASLIRERSQSMNTAIGCGILIDILRKSQTDEGKFNAAECLARLAHLKSGLLSHINCLISLFFGIIKN